VLKAFVAESAPPVSAVPTPLDGVCEGERPLVIAINAASSLATRSRSSLSSGSGDMDGASHGSYCGRQLDASPRALHCEHASASVVDEYSVRSPALVLMSACVEEGYI